MRNCSARRLKPIVLLWACVISCLFAILFWHDKSGVQPESVAERPCFDTESTTSVSACQADELHVELYVHPECPCTRTTLKLLDRLFGELTFRPHLTIYVASYAQSSIDWNSSTNRQLAVGLEHAIVLEDQEASRAKSKGALASGTLVIENELEELVFAGGLTGSRSCDDLNSSYFAVKSLLSKRQHKAANSIVYGCPL